MSYAKITFDDPNGIKRWLQRRRIVSAIDLIPDGFPASVFCDFGAGNGELCKLLVQHSPAAKIFCFEPDAERMNEARENLPGFGSVEFVRHAEALPDDSADVLFCLEVLEHLPEIETQTCLDHISRILKPDGVVIVGVPIEIGLPALYKGCFRIARKRLNATVPRMLRAIIGRQPDIRERKLMPGGTYYCATHIGYDYRPTIKNLKRRFSDVRISASPFPVLGTLNPEIYLIGRKPAPSRRGAS